MLVQPTASSIGRTAKSVSSTPHRAELAVGYECVKEAVRELKSGRQEVFLPLSHPPGEAQVDFGHGYVEVAGELIQRQGVVTLKVRARFDRLDSRFPVRILGEGLEDRES
jgi:hypothetical protein